MVVWPDLGTRVTVRYRRPTGSVPPLTDAVGHLLAIDPAVRVRTKTGALVECAPTDVVALRVLTDAPIRTAQIRALEQAASAAGPTIEQTWLDGWLLRSGPGATLDANSAVPLNFSAQPHTIPGIIAWYVDRGRRPMLAIPDRLLRLPDGLEPEGAQKTLVRDALERHPPSDPEFDPERGAAVTLGEFARATVTDAPDGTRWVGLSELRVAEHAPEDCEVLLAWGARRGATRAYLRVDEDDATTTAFAESLGFRLHHHTRYFAIRPGSWDSV
jgi:N-acetylglutamate synthase